MPEPGGASGGRASQVRTSTVHPDDAGWPAYVGLFADYRAHYGGQREPERCDRWLREHVGRGRVLCYLATVEDGGGHGKPAAMALVVPSPASQSLAVFWQLRDLFVAPAHRRTGVGRAVVTAVADAARSAGALRLALQTETGNLPAQALYHGLGFEDVGGYLQMLLTL